MTDEMLKDKVPIPIGSKVYVPAEIGREPESAGDALRSAKALLAEEGRWARFCYFASSHEATIDDPYCGSWSACAVGALQLVTLGVQYRPGWQQWRPIEDDHLPFPEILVGQDELPRWIERHRIYTEALEHLDEAAAEIATGGNRTYPPGAISFNDTWATDREDVLAMFDVAIAKAAA